MTPTETVIGKLSAAGCNPRQSRPGQWTSRCPNGAGHKNGDRHPSLSIAEGRDGCVVHCEGGCDTAKVVEALGLHMTDLFPPKERDEGPRRVAATYPYVDEEGTLVFEAVRYEPKGFAQRRPDGRGGWVWNLQGIDRRPLYRLPQTMAAIANGETIWIAEGEKDVDALVRAGQQATCNPMGAGKWRPEHTGWMADAKLVEIVADDDDAGRAHAATVAEVLRHAGITTRVWLPHPDCKDIAEHLGQGRPLSDLRPAEQAPEPPSRLRQNLYIGAAIFDLPPVQWLIQDVIQADGLAVVYGAPKSFKTFVTLDMALHIANGVPWRDLKVSQRKVLYVVAEGAPGVGPRARAWCSRFGGSVDNVAWLTVAPNLFDERDGDVSEVVDIAVELGVGLVIIDTLARAMAGAEENSAKDMGIMVNHLDRIKEQAGCAVLVVHHTGKEQSRGMRGSNSLQGAVDTSIEVVGDKHAVNARVADSKNAESDKAWWWKPAKEDPSLVLEPTSGLEGSGEVRDLNILRQLFMVDTGGGSSSSTWFDAVSDVGIYSHGTFHKRLKAMQEDGLIHNNGSESRPKWAVTSAGLAFMRTATDQ